MGDASAKWALDVEADATSAVEAAKSLEELREALLLSESGLKSLQQTMRTYKDTSYGTKETTDKLKASQKAMREITAKAHERFLAAGGNLKDKYRPQLKAAAVDSTALKDALLKSIPGASRLTSAFKGVSLSAVGIAAGVVLAAAAVVALAVGLAAATVAGARFALTQADMARSQKIAIEQSLIYDQMVRRLRGIKDVTAYTEQYDQAISRVARNVPVARAQVAATFAELQKFRLTGDTLEKAARASLLVGGVGRFMALGYSAKFAGQGIAKTAAIIEKKFGDTNKRAMMSLNVQVMKLKESFLGMFRTLRIDSILGAFQKFADLFSETTITGSALKTIVEGLFKPLESVAGGPIFKVIKAAFEGLIIAALYATLGVLKLKNWLEKTFSGTTIGQIDELDIALGVAAVTLGVASVAAVSLAVALAGVVGMAALVAAPFAGLYAAIKSIREIGLYETGKNLMLGLLKGIGDGAVSVIDAVRSLAARIKGTIETSLGIHSRARFGIYAGQMLGAGLSFGVKSRAPEVASATGGLARAAAGGVATASAAPRGAAGTVMHIQSLIGSLVLQGNQDDPADLERKMEEVMATALERLAIKRGVTFQLGGG